MKKRGLVLLVIFALAFVGGIFFIATRPTGGIKYRWSQSTMKGLAGAIEAYYASYDACPTGDNAAVIKQLRGNNPKKITFLTLGSASMGLLSSNGEFLDGYGTPYLIQLSTNTIYIRSAGRNRTFGDADDLVLDQPLR